MYVVFKGDNAIVLLAQVVYTVTCVVTATGSTTIDVYLSTSIGGTYHALLFSNPTPTELQAAKNRITALETNVNSFYDSTAKRLTAKQLIIGIDPSIHYWSIQEELQITKNRLPLVFRDLPVAAGANQGGSRVAFWPKIWWDTFRPMIVEQPEGPSSVSYSCSAKDVGIDCLL